MKIYEDLCSFIISRSFFTEWEMFQTKVEEKIETHFVFRALFFPKSRRLCNNVEIYCTAGQATADNIRRRMRIACWIPKATNTLSTCCFSMAIMVTQTRLDISVYVHCLSWSYSLLSSDRILAYVTPWKTHLLRFPTGSSSTSYFKIQFLHHIAHSASYSCHRI